MCILFVRYCYVHLISTLCVLQYGTMILVMEDLTSFMIHRPRFWLNLLTVLEATFIGDTPSSILLVQCLLLYQRYTDKLYVAMPVSCVWNMEYIGQVFTVSFVNRTVKPLLGIPQVKSMFQHQQFVTFLTENQIETRKKCLALLLKLAGV